MSNQHSTQLYLSMYLQVAFVIQVLDLIKLNIFCKIDDQFHSFLFNFLIAKNL